MHSIADLEKQQVGFRMPTYLLNNIDEIIGDHQVNRSEFLIAATKNYIDLMREEMVYKRLGEAMAEVRLDLDGKIQLKSAQSLLDEC